MCYREGRAFLVGLTSFGSSNCKEPEHPGVYSRACRNIAWIRQKMKQVSLSHFGGKRIPSRFERKRPVPDDSQILSLEPENVSDEN